MPGRMDLSNRYSLLSVRVLRVTKCGEYQLRCPVKPSLTADERFCTRLFLIPLDARH